MLRAAYLVGRVRQLYTADGLRGLGSRALLQTRRSLVFPAQRLLWRKKTFRFDSQLLRFAIRFHNHTWTNERCIELAVAEWFVAGQASVLEVGNVLSHYGPVHHEVIDLYETAPGVRNVDVVDYRPDQVYDRIVTVSTIEHVGLDEPEKRPAKAEEAIRHLRRLLSPSGRLLVTVPMGYNPTLDDAIFAGRLGPSATEVYVRSGRRSWETSSLERVRQLPYDYRAHGGCLALWVGVFEPLGQQRPQS